MGRYRSRSRSYSPRHVSRSPPRRKRYDDPRDHLPRGGDGRDFRDRRSAAPCGLLIRNISLDARPEDLRVPFERFGAVRDVYLPKNYYTREPRGFGFVKFRNADDAAEAKYHMNHQIIGGREISIVYAEENRKTPQDMRSTGRNSGRYGGGGNRRSPPRSPRGRFRSNSRSPSRHDSRNLWAGKEAGTHAVIILHQGLSLHHLVVGENTIQRNVLLVPRGMPQVHLGLILDRTVLVDDGSVLALASTKRTMYELVIPGMGEYLEDAVVLLRMLTSFCYLGLDELKYLSM